MDKMEFIICSNFVDCKLHSTIAPDLFLSICQKLRKKIELEEETLSFFLVQIFAYLKVLCKDDELTKDFLDYSLEPNKVHCVDDPCISGCAYCGRCTKKCKRMIYLFQVFWYLNTDNSYEKNRVFVTCSIKYIDIFVKLYEEYYVSLPDK